MFKYKWLVVTGLVGSLMGLGSSSWVSARPQNSKCVDRACPKCGGRDGPGSPFITCCNYTSTIGACQAGTMWCDDTTYGYPCTGDQIGWDPITNTFPECKTYDRVTPCQGGIATGNSCTSYTYATKTWNGTFYACPGVS